jgi:hypothetical protein
LRTTDRGNDDLEITGSVTGETYSREKEEERGERRDGDRTPDPRL